MFFIFLFWSKKAEVGSLPFLQLPALPSTAEYSWDGILVQALAKLLCTSWINSFDFLIISVLLDQALRYFSHSSTIPFLHFLLSLIQGSSTRGFKFYWFRLIFFFWNTGTSVSISCFGELLILPCSVCLIFSHRMHKAWGRGVKSAPCNYLNQSHHI